MQDAEKFVLIDKKVLPPIYLKVLEAKLLIAKGSVKNSSDAIKAVGISRSAFYKYKDNIFLPTNQNNDEIMTISFKLLDEVGVLSELISYFYNYGSNILTLNQNIPVDSVAFVSLSIRVNGVSDKQEMINNLSKVHGVIEAKFI